MHDKRVATCNVSMMDSDLEWLLLSMVHLEQLQMLLME